MEIKKFLILSILVVVVLITLWWCIIIRYDDPLAGYAAITLEKLDRIPENFVEITETDLDKHPVLKDALEELNRTGEDRINYKTTEDKGKKILYHIESKYAEKYDTPQRGTYIQYKEKFYSIALMIS